MKSTLYVFTGAGLSAASGIGTFRDQNGLWEQHDVDQVCNINTWRDNLHLMHAFYSARRTHIHQALPNAAHHAIADWQQRYSDVCILTQNIDMLLEQAGCTNVIHLHGRYNNMRCMACKHDWDQITVWDPDTHRCAQCGSDAVKPGVIFFGEHAPQYVHYVSMLRNLRPQDVLVVIGTSAQVLDIGNDVKHIQCHKILNNLEASDWIDDQIFDHVFYQSAPEAAADITRILDQLLL